MDPRVRKVALMSVLAVVSACAVSLVYLRTVRDDGNIAAEATAATPTPTPTAAGTEPVYDIANTQETEPEPEAYDYILSFAGDCTLGTLLEWQTGVDEAFPGVVGDNYAYPLSNVEAIFQNDDFTMVNLECALTDSDDAIYKKYRLKGDPAYAAVLSGGAVDAVSLANNHSGDFGAEGLADTRAALTSEGIRYGETGGPLVIRLEGGMTLGIVCYNTVENALSASNRLALIAADIQACEGAGCDFILAFMHWGWEYYTEPEAWQVQLAHEMIDLGCGLVIGSHPHILQKIENYNGTPILYSLGNFCFGGNLNPDDKDTAIVQATVRYDAENAAAKLVKLDVIPCSISSLSSKNDYCPTPYEAGSTDFERVLKKLGMITRTLSSRSCGR
jgi:poly-gamma-glutamate synthesis protein (capsule biosynthesis protein)